MRHPSPALVAFALVVCSGGLCTAAPDAGAKASGEYNFYGHSVHATMQSARAQMTHYGDYLDRVQAAGPAVTVNAELARETSDAIGDSIARMRRHIATMRAHATTLNDQQALGMLDDVERQLAEAATHHAALHETHGGQTIDAATAKAHADKVNAALEKAQAEHDEVMARLGDTAN
jgi:hypothetical protein